ncbi:MAG: GAF domain-containing protein [Deltaproteobacteria bacterium]|nr:GAF domain-containing protein [Deltaproteobacteria bacterium]
MKLKEDFITVPFDSSQLVTRNRELAAVLEMSEFLASQRTPEDVLTGGLTKAMEIFDMPVGRIYRLDPDGQHLTMVAHRGVATGGLERMSLAEGFTGKSARTRSFLAQPVDALEDADRVKLLKSRGIGTVICVPLVALDELVGVINLAAHGQVTLDIDRVDLMLVMGNLIAVALDNTRRAQELVAHAAELKARKEAVEFFAYTLGHDLKSPAAAVGALVRLLMKRSHEQMDDKARETCHQISAAAEHISELVGEINAYIKAKEAALNLEALDVPAFLKELCLEFQSRLEERGIRLVAVEPLPPVVADRVNLARLFRNLVDNALKYGGPGLKTIRVSHRPCPEGHLFEVADDGQGFAPDQADVIFHLFKRARSSEGTEGTGLGLSVVREVARRHGGRAWAESRPGGGASFFFTLAQLTPGQAPPNMLD